MVRFARKSRALTACSGSRPELQPVDVGLPENALDVASRQREEPAERQAVKDRQVTPYKLGGLAANEARDRPWSFRTHRSCTAEA